MELELAEEDQDNIDHALDHMIDSVAKFKGDSVSPEDFYTFLNILDYTRYIIGGVMYEYGIPFMIDEDNDDE